MGIYVRFALILIFVATLTVLQTNDAVYATGTFTETSSITSVTSLEGSDTSTNKNDNSSYFVAMFGFLIIAIFAGTKWYAHYNTNVGKI